MQLSSFARAKREEPAKKLWGFADYHFSDAGHALVADEMQKFVTELID